MSYRVDVEYRDGKLSTREDSSKADTRKPLPKVNGTDRLNSDKWGASLKNETGVPDLVIDAIADTHAVMVRSFQDLVSIRDNQSPEMTQAAHLNHLGQVTDRTLNRLAEQATRVQNRTEERLKSVQAESRQALQFVDRGNAAELRAILRGMDDKQRGETIMSGIDAHDGELMAAVFDRVHPLQIGMDGKRHQATFDNALNKHAPQLLNLRKGLEKGRDLVRNTFTDLLENSDTISAKQIRDQYQEQAKKAKEAAGKLNRME
jgi:hypothetical protein